MEQSNQTVEATWDIALKIWWWIFWRSSLTAIIGSFIISLIVLLISSLAKVEMIQDAAPLVLGIFGFVVYVYFFKKVLNRKFEGFTLVLLKTEKKYLKTKKINESDRMKKDEGEGLFNY